MRVEALPGQAVDPHEAQDFAHAPTTLAAADSPDAQGVFDVLEGGQNRYKVEALKDKADAVSTKLCCLPSRQIKNIHPCNLQATTRRLV